MKNVTLLVLFLLSPLFVLTQPCLPEGISFDNQQQIDNFQSMYPNCTTIEGDVVIWDWSINDLSGLSSIATIEGSLKIIETSLKNLTGLEELQHVNGALLIRHNDSLVNVNGLNSLSTIGHELDMQNNYYLNNISALNNLISIGGGIHLRNLFRLDSINGLDNLVNFNGGLTIHECPVISLQPFNNTSELSHLYLRGLQLHDLTGLNNLTSVSWYVEIVNTSIVSTHGMELLSEIGGSFTFKSHPNLSSYSGFQNVNAIGGDVTIEYNSSISGLNGITEINGDFKLSNIENMTGLNNLVQVKGDAIITECDLEGLSSLNEIDGSLTFEKSLPLYGLENLLSVGGSLTILEGGIQDLQGLNGLTTIGGRLEIKDDDNLKNLSGLQNLESIGTDIKIHDNLILNSLYGIDNISPQSIINLSIYNNPSLSMCKIKSICEYLSSPNGAINIYGNWAECEDRAAVETSCEDFSVEESNIYNLLKIYPNPAQQELNISLESLTINEVTIYSLTGQQRQHAMPVEGTIDISHLIPGIYIVDVLIEDTHIRQKLVVQR